MLSQTAMGRAAVPPRGLQLEVSLHLLAAKCSYAADILINKSISISCLIPSVRQDVMLKHGGSLTSRYSWMSHA